MKIENFEDEHVYVAIVNFTPNTPVVKHLYDTFRVLSIINTRTYDKKMKTNKLFKISIFLILVVMFSCNKKCQRDSETSSYYEVFSPGKKLEKGMSVTEVEAVFGKIILDEEYGYVWSTVRETININGKKFKITNHLSFGTNYCLTSHYYTFEGRDNDLNILKEILLVALKNYNMTFEMKENALYNAKKKEKLEIRVFQGDGILRIDVIFWEK
jgi:hypothetical protein